MSAEALRTAGADSAITGLVERSVDRPDTAAAVGHREVDHRGADQESAGTRAFAERLPQQAAEHAEHENEGR